MLTRTHGLERTELLSYKGLVPQILSLSEASDAFQSSAQDEGSSRPGTKLTLSFDGFKKLIRSITSSSRYAAARA